MDGSAATDIDELTPDLVRLRIAFVNVYFVGPPRSADALAPPPEWTLIDAGLALGTGDILRHAAERFGGHARPTSIVLTHGHFDHVGALDALLRVWDVPVYAHRLELPFLTGRADYPPPDPTVGRGLMARLSPERGIDLGTRVRPLPETGEVPGLPGWRWVPTPGHSPGHVSFFREADRTLIAGDAMSTTRPESTFSVLRQRQEINGPPAYLTIDWEKAKQSFEVMHALQPALIASGHGETIRGGSLREEMAALAGQFEQRARPREGRYVTQPALTNEHGIVSLPPAPRSSGVRWGMLSGVAATAFAATWLYRRFGTGKVKPE